MKILDGISLRIEDVVAISRDHEPAQLSDPAIERMERSQQFVQELLHSDTTVYGVNTGFGSLVSDKISINEVNALQLNLIRSHSCGVGDPLPLEIVRAMMLLRVNSLARGFSGIRPQVVQLLLHMLNKKIHPIVPSRGSIGASGDLIPLAHIARCLIGEGTVEYHGSTMTAKDAFHHEHLDSMTLTAKEGLALINGTQLMSALGCFSVFEADQLLLHAQIAGAMSLEALKGTNQAFRAEIHSLRPHPGQVACAENLWRLTQHSQIMQSHKDCTKIQDAYSLRCMPQVFGASKDVFTYVRNVLSIEINAVTDNPVLISDTKESISGGNFHGQPIAFALDFLAIALAEIGSISERRIARLIDTNLSGLPAFLTAHHGLHSGLMLLQYAAAALVNENKILCHPNSCDSIPSSANKEDHVSMGANAGLKLRQIISNVRTILAIELIAASQALEFIKPLQPSPPLQRSYELIRSMVPALVEDRSLETDIKTIEQLIQSNRIVQIVTSLIGPLS